MNTPSEKHAINTHVRLFDLVRFMRAELHQADLITSEEYAWLCMEAPLSKGGGSPSPRRLEDYDDIRARLTALAAENKALLQRIEDPFVHESPSAKFHEWLARYGLVCVDAKQHAPLAARVKELEEIVREDNISARIIKATNDTRGKIYAINRDAVFIISRTQPVCDAIRSAMKKEAKP